MDALIKMAGGDRALAELLRQSLEILAGLKDRSAMSDLARDMLAGNVGPRAALTSPAYESAVREGAQGFRAWRERIGEEEFLRCATQVSETAERMRERVSRELHDPRR